MGQTINPCGLRIPVIKDWESRWIYLKGNDEILVLDTKAKTKKNKTWNSHHLKIKTYTAFIRAVKKKVTKRTTLPRKKVLA